MRRLIMWMTILCMAACLFFAIPLPAAANSGPTFWTGYPSYEILAVDKNCPIQVESEKLVFDLSGDNRYSYTIGGQVTASYSMINPTDENLSVQMAFPFISTLNSFSKDDISIMADGMELPYDIFIGDVVDSHGAYRQQEDRMSFDFDDIVSKITHQPYQSKYFSEDEKGKLYIFEVKPTTEQNINFAVEFEFSFEKTRILVNRFNRYERSGQKVRIASWCNGPEYLEILVLGDDVDFAYSAYIDGELKEKTELFECEISEMETWLKTYLMNFQVSDTVSDIKESRFHDMYSQQQLYNMYAAALDRLFASGEGFGSLSDLTSQYLNERILTLVYTVDFPAGAKRNVSVSYKATGTMDKTKTQKPIYTFDYILNPAGNWSSFGNMDIEIFTPREAPYIISSNIELTRKGDRHYTASLTSLPDDDFTFSVYSKESITVFDKSYNYLKRRIGYLLPVIIPGIIFILLAIAGVVLVRSITAFFKKM